MSRFEFIRRSRTETIKIVQRHASVGVSNEDLAGKTLTPE